jgi:hypothetical protein
MKKVGFWYSKEEPKLPMPVQQGPDQFKTDAIYGRIDKSGRGEKAGIFQDSMLD